MNRPDEDLLRHADRLRAAGDHAGAVAAYLDATRSCEAPAAPIALRIAQCMRAAGDGGAAASWIRRVVDGGDDYRAWQAAANLLDATPAGDRPTPKRALRVGIIGSYTTTQFTALLRLAAFRLGLELDTYEAPYGQYQQDLLDPTSGLATFEPDVVVLATHWGAIDTSAGVDAEVARWRGLWRAGAQRLGASLVHHDVAVPPGDPLGHLAGRVPSSSTSVLREVNRALAAAAAEDGVAIVEADRLAAEYGKRAWFDPRYWHLSKQAVALGGVPLLARHTAAVIAAHQGLGAKCVVLDLDNTLWGGVVGEDGLEGIELGGSARGEAYQAFQDYLRQLRRRGVLLAVCSKNDEAEALRPFIEHPEMRLHVDDITVFSAGWDAKAELVEQIATTLDLGLDALLFVDDNPREREELRQRLPDVEVVLLPDEPFGYIDALAAHPLLEPAHLTDEDERRTELYRARADAKAALEAADGLDGFYASLAMRATVQPFSPVDLGRIVQLVNKTNQFNLTTRRYDIEAIQHMLASPECVHLSVSLTDRFADHGLVAVAIAFDAGDVLTIDTWLMSCRVIGRTLEHAVMEQLHDIAARRGCGAIIGTYRPTPKNGLVKDLYAALGFTLVSIDAESGATTWRLAVGARELPLDHHIDIVRQEEAHGRA